MKRFLLALSLLTVCFNVFSASYSVKVGSELRLECTATAPAGYITHAFFMLKNSSDSKYLTVQSFSSEQYAILTGLEACANIPVEVIYTYSYTGSYDRKTHVGQGTYTEYVTVTAGPAVTSLQITPSDPFIKIGESVTVSLLKTPENASSSCEWGIVSTLGQPYAFVYEFNGNTASITAKSEGKLYIVAQSSNGKSAACVVTASKDSPDSKQDPTSISMPYSFKKIPLNKSVTLTVVFSPSGSSSTVKWTSSDESVATVGTDGSVKGIACGKAVITATTENNLSASVNVDVYCEPSEMSLSYEGEMYLGYKYRLNPIFTPAGAYAACTWSSSNTAIATVSQDGIVKPLKAGVATITAKVGSTLKATVEIMVADSAEHDYRIVSDRIASVKSLVLKSISTK